MSGKSEGRGLSAIELTLSAGYRDVLLQTPVDASHEPKVRFCMLQSNTSESRSQLMASGLLKRLQGHGVQLPSASGPSPQLPFAVLVHELLQAQQVRSDETCSPLENCVPAQPCTAWLLPCRLSMQLSCLTLSRLHGQSSGRRYLTSRHSAQAGTAVT